MKEVLGNGPLPAEIIGVLSDRLHVAVEDDVTLLTEKLSVCPLHAFLVHIATRTDPLVGFERIYLLGVDQYGMVHLLN